MSSAAGSSRCLVIAEVGSVHDGSFGNATRLIETAAECGADAVKFQTHIAAAETIRDAPSPPYFSAEPRYEYFERTAFTRQQWRELRAVAERSGVEFLSSPFSVEAVDLLEDVGVPRYKIPSGEVTNLPLLERVALTGKPVLLSSGMSSWDELDHAVATIRRRHDRLTVLQCTSEYPCPPERVGLNVIPEMRARYAAPVGLSDHTLSVWTPVAAVALGASVVEKHLTFSRRMYGSDARHSLEPAEFASMVEGIRAVERMLASPVDKSDVTAFAVMKETFEKSVVSTRAIAAGTVIARDALAVKKPGTGLRPEMLDRIVGLRAARPIAADAVLTFEDVRWEEGPPLPAARTGGSPRARSV